jgi:hypothetical protein
MQIVVKMKVRMSPPGRILKEQPLTARARPPGSSQSPKGATTGQAAAS